MRLVPLSHVTMMSPPFGVIGRPVAVSMYAISGDVPSTPVSLMIRIASIEAEFLAALVVEGVRHSCS
jgi:hypothetical protein